MSSAATRATSALAVAAALLAIGLPGLTSAALAQGGGGVKFGPGARNDLGPRYEPYPERMWESYTRTGKCPPLTVRTRQPNGKVAVQRVPWNPKACGFNTLE